MNEQKRPLELGTKLLNELFKEDAAPPKIFTAEDVGGEDPEEAQKVADFMNGVSPTGSKKLAVSFETAIVEAA